MYPVPMFSELEYSFSPPRTQRPVSPTCIRSPTGLENVVCTAASSEPRTEGLRVILPASLGFLVVYSYAEPSKFSLGRKTTAAHPSH